MTNRELIEMLSEMDPEQEVCIDFDSVVFPVAHVFQQCDESEENGNGVILIVANPR